MKKLYITLSIISLSAALCCCSREDVVQTADSQQQSVELVPATVIAEDALTRTSLDGKSVKWIAGDEIAVFPDGGNIRKFTTNDAGTKAVFDGLIPVGATKMYAIYPYSPSSICQDLKVSATLPQLQTAFKGGFADDIAIMTASGSFASFKATTKFKQVCGLVKFTITGDNITKVDLNAPDAAAIAGDFKIPFDQTEPQVVKPVGTITLTPQGQTFQPGDYYIVAMPAAVKGCSLVYYSGTRTKTRNLEGELKLERATVTTLAGSDADYDWDDAGMNVTVNIATPVKLKETQTGSAIYEGVVTMPASCQFTITIGTDEYGFVSYSGAGGIGRVNNANSSLPYYNIANAKTTKTDYGYSVGRAIGRMAKISDGANKFYTNMSAAGEVFVRVDRTVAEDPVYYFEAVRAADPSVVFHEDFDLFTCGGDYIVAIAGTGTDSKTGLSGKKDGNTANQPGISFDYPTKVSPCVVAELKYLTNRGLNSEWEFVYAGERPGAVQLCSGSEGGRLKTPVLKGLSGATNVTIALDIARFSSTSVDPISITLVGGGSFVSASVDVEPYAAAKTEADHKEYTGLSGDTFEIVDDKYCPHSLGNNDADKPHSFFIFKISGATPQTSILIDAPKGAKNAPRCFVYDIKVTK